MINFACVYTSGANLAITIEQLSPTPSYYDASQNAFVEASPSWSNKNLELFEGASENKGSYSTTLDNETAFPSGQPKLCRIRVHDVDDPDHATIELRDVYINDNQIVYLDKRTSELATPDNLLETLTNAIESDIALAELDEVPPATPTISQAVMLIYMMLRNGGYASDKVKRHFADDGTAFTEQSIVENETTSQMSKMKNIG